MQVNRLYLLYGIAALIVVLLAFLIVNRPPPPLHGPLGFQPHYDVVFKYCFNQPRDPGEEQRMIGDQLYRMVRDMPPGEYETTGDGRLFLFGAGMFELQLPERERTVRSIGDGTPTQPAGGGAAPESVIGCTPGRLATALRTYNVRPLR